MVRFQSLYCYIMFTIFKNTDIKRKRKMLILKSKYYKWGLYYSLPVSQKSSCIYFTLRSFLKLFPNRGCTKVIPGFTS